jgi:hypothetical protein
MYSNLNKLTIHISKYLRFGNFLKIVVSTQSYLMFNFFFFFILSSMNIIFLFNINNLNWRNSRNEITNE